MTSPTLVERLQLVTDWWRAPGHLAEEAASRISALEQTQAELVEELADALDTFEKLRADLAEEDCERHAQRIAVLNIHIEQQRALIAKLETQS